MQQILMRGTFLDDIPNLMVPKSRFGLFRLDCNRRFLRVRLCFTISFVP